MSAGPAVLVDGPPLVYRAFHAIPPSFMTSRGEPTNAVYGFTSMLLKALGDLQPGDCAGTFAPPPPPFGLQGPPRPYGGRPAPPVPARASGGAGLRPAHLRV